MENFYGTLINCCADPRRLRPPAGVLARGLKTLRVFLTPAPRPRFESMRRPPKRKAPVAGGFQFQMVRRIGLRIRCADPHRLRPPAGGLARSLRTLRVRFTLAPRPRFESPQCSHIRKAPVAGSLKSIGAAYRIRTYDVLIRSQTLYPAEVTPQRTDYYARDPSMGQATIWKIFTVR